VQGEFTDEGTETSFQLGTADAYVLTSSTQEKHGRMSHLLFVDDVEMQPANTDDRSSSVGWS